MPLSNYHKDIPYSAPDPIISISLIGCLKSQRKYNETKAAMEEYGYVFKAMRCFKILEGSMFIEIEFCLGDCCVGLYDKRDNLLIKDKIPCKNLIEAWAVASIMEIDNSISLEK